MKADNRFILLVLLAFSVAFVPHIFRLPLWITLWCLVFWGYRAGAAVWGWPLPWRTLKLGLTVSGVFLVGIHYGIGFNREASVALLAIMISLKPYEIHSHRDRMVSLFLGFFVVITSLLFSNSLLMTVYMFISVLTTTTVLVHINHPSGRLNYHFMTAARIMGFSIPLMLFFFFLFPRIQGSLWGFYQSGSAKTGFSNHLAPGSITQLVQNDDIAFRVEFHGPKPSPAQLYWRGIVFSYFDGLNWKHLPAGLGRLPRRQASEPIEYTVILEPHQNKWLFALDLPVYTDVRGKLLSDYTIRSRYPVKRQKTYRVLSILSYRNLNPSRRWEDHLQIPPFGHESAKALAQTWKNNLTDPQKIMAAALAYFTQNDFQYTLNPPPLEDDPIDQFLFETRSGYCEHFASAFAFLMRAAGMPARIVGGYLGGEVNPYGDYMIVRQADAHVWVEVWLPKKGWVRVDPTSVVAPARITQGMMAALPPQDQPTFLRNPLWGTANRYWRSLFLGWDALNSFWSRKIIAYSFQSQKAFLQRLGLKTASWQQYLKFFLVALLLVGIMVFILALWLIKKPPAPRDKILRIYQKYCTKLTQAGIPKPPAQGPLDYAVATIANRPDLKCDIEGITQAYIRLRYGAQKSDRDIKRFAQKVRHFKPAKATIN